MKNLILTHNSVPIPIDICFHLTPIELSICVKAIAMLANKSGVIPTNKVVTELAFWAEVDEQKVIETLSSAFNLKPSGFTDQIFISPPNIKIGKPIKQLITVDKSVTNPEFIAQCRADFPQYDIDEELALFITKMRELKYAITQNGFLGSLRKKRNEDQFLATKTEREKVCLICNNTGLIEEYLLGELQMASCPSCSS